VTSDGLLEMTAADVDKVELGKRAAMYGRFATPMKIDMSL
jgi:hypothetical protein